MLNQLYQSTYGNAILDLDNTQLYMGRSKIRCRPKIEFPSADSPAFSPETMACCIDVSTVGGLVQYLSFMKAERKHR